MRDLNYLKTEIEEAIKMHLSFVEAEIQKEFNSGMCLAFKMVLSWIEKEDVR